MISLFDKIAFNYKFVSPIDIVAEPFQLETLTVSELKDQLQTMEKAETDHFSEDVPLEVVSNLEENFINKMNTLK